MTAPEEAELRFAIFGSPAVAKWSVTGEVQTHNKGVHEMMAASFICLSLVYSFCSGSHTYLCMHRGSAGSWEVPHSPSPNPLCPVPHHHPLCSGDQCIVIMFNFISHLCRFHLGKSFPMCWSVCRETEAAKNHIFGCLTACYAIPKATGRAQTLEEGRWL